MRAGNYGCLTREVLISGLRFVLFVALPTR
jgi:hypothetical protein